jgi:hypothetical protein
MAGLGLFGIGSTPFGSGTPVAATAPPSDIPEQANFLDPVTGDYVVLDDGALARMPNTRHRVLMLLKTVLASAAHLPDVGLEMPTRMDQTFKQRTKGAVLFALEPIGDDIRIDDVTVEVTGTGRADVTVSYTDLTTGNSDTVTV